MRVLGEMKMQNYRIYRGNFKDDKIQGVGMLMMASSGIIYEGKFN